MSPKEAWGILAQVVQVLKATPAEHQTIAKALEVLKPEESVNGNS